MKAPFPWLGGKSRVADIVWQRLGETCNYVEPLFGSDDVLLGRPVGPGRNETVNDLDCYLAISGAQSAGPGIHCGMGRHLWLINQIKFRERIRSDPDHFDGGDV